MARAHASQGNPYGPLYMLAAALTVGCSIAILVIVNSYLWYTSYYYGGYVYYWTNTCYMQTPSSQDSTNICYYSWAAAGVGLFFSLWLLFMQLCSGRSRHLPVCEVMVCFFATLWWIGCAVTGQVYGQDADSYATNTLNSSTASPSAKDYAAVLQDKQGWRTSVWALAYAQVGVFAICFLLSLKDCCSFRGKPPPQAAAPQPAYPTGAYAQPGYQDPGAAYGQQPYGYGAPPQGAPAYGAPPPPYYGAPPPQGGAAYPPAPGYPPAQPASPFSSTAPAGYPPANTA